MICESGEFIIFKLAKHFIVYFCNETVSVTSASHMMWLLNSSTNSIYQCLQWDLSDNRANTLEGSPLKPTNQQFRFHMSSSIPLTSLERIDESRQIHQARICWCEFLFTFYGTNVRFYANRKLPYASPHFTAPIPSEERNQNLWTANHFSPSPIREREQEKMLEQIRRGPGMRFFTENLTHFLWKTRKVNLWNGEFN